MQAGDVVLVMVDPAQANELAEGRCPLPAVADYPHADTSAAARLARDGLSVDNWVPGYGMYLIEVAGLIVGDVGFHTPPDERGSVEIGYGLAPSARGNGYATAGVDALARWALGHGAAVVRAEVDADNGASIAVLKRAGFSELRGQDEASVRRYQRLA